MFGLSAGAAAALGAGAATIGGALISSNAVGDAADAQAASSAAGTAEQRRQFDLTRSDYAPYRETGVRALGSLEADINKAPTADEVMAGPGYQFGLQQGQQAIDRRTAAAGGRVSGAALKRAGMFATDYATTGYNAEYQRRQDRLNRLASIAGIGQTATAGSAAAGANAANAISGIATNQGDATGAAQVARGNIWGGAVNQLGAAAGRWASTSTPINPYQNYGGDYNSLDYRP